MEENPDVGIPSIRIMGKKLDDLPMVASVHAQKDMPEVYRTDRENKEAAIRARYPKIDISYIDSRMRECRENIERLTRTKTEQINLISEYQGLLQMCQYRDKIKKQGADLAHVRQIEKECPWNTDALKTQIMQSETAISRVDEVVAQEHASIQELVETRAKITQRDAEIQALG